VPAVLGGDNYHSGGPVQHPGFVGSAPAETHEKKEGERDVDSDTPRAVEHTCGTEALRRPALLKSGVRYATGCPPNSVCTCTCDTSQNWRGWKSVSGLAAAGGLPPASELHQRNCGNEEACPDHPLRTVGSCMLVRPPHQEKT
jgi:hypothetical protein